MIFFCSNTGVDSGEDKIKFLKAGLHIRKIRDGKYAKENTHAKYLSVNTILVYGHPIICYHSLFNNPS